MATILSEMSVSDGYDVHFRTGGKQYMLHFAAAPTEAARDEAILLMEQRMIDDIAAAKVIEQEESLI